WRAAAEGGGPAGGGAKPRRGSGQPSPPSPAGVTPPEGPAEPFAAADAGPAWPYRFYGRAELLTWWTRRAALPPLVTAGTPESLGFLGQPGTTILLGDERKGHDVRLGGRFTLGWWLDDRQRTAVEGSYFFLGRRSARFIVGSDSVPLIARPFFNLNQGIEFAQVATFPGEVNGGVAVELPSRLWGAQLNVRRNLCRGCCYDVGLLA